MRDHGFMILTLTNEKAQAQWKFVETLKEPNLTIKEVNMVWVMDGEVKIQGVSNEDLNL